MIRILENLEKRCLVEEVKELVLQEHFCMMHH